MESIPATSSKSFLFIVIAIIIVVGVAAMFYIITLPTERVTSVSEPEKGHISGIIDGPAVINITPIP